MMRAPSPNDPFYLILSGDFAAAVRAYDVLATQQPRTSVYMNRAIAHLNLGAFDRSLADFEMARELNRTLPFRTDSVLLWSGVAWWLRGERARAVASWHEAVRGVMDGDITMSDPAGGVAGAGMLWFGAPDSGTEWKDAVKLLRKRAKRDPWPGPIAPYLIGKLTEAELLAAAQRDSERLAARQLCQAYFYLGARAKRDGRPEDAMKYFRTALMQGPSSLVEMESYLAKAETA